MVPLDWSLFKKLPGDPRINFENLCRGIVSLTWGQVGQLKSLKNQPGVEFHLKIDKSGSALGDANRWYGWQCKNFTLNTKNGLSKANKKDIEDSLAKSEKYLPDLTDWILWTPFTLIKADQDWFFSLKSKYTLHLWTRDEVENNLSGAAIYLRATYFGELIVTPDDLKKQHEISIAPIKERWMQPAHQSTGVERTLGRMLGYLSSWEDVAELGAGLSRAADVIEKFSIDIPDLDTDREDFVGICKNISDVLSQFHRLIEDGDLDILRQWLADRHSLLTSHAFKFVRSLRKRNISLALEATNALDDMAQALEVLHEVDDYLSTGVVAVLADAGGGKTHMAAQLTAPQEDRPAGVFLHGKNLHKGHDQSDIARNFSINGHPVDSIEKLFAAVDAAAKRARCRLPIIIDGLNEAENPKEWKPILASVQVLAKSYPNILIICTLRTGEHSRGSYYNSETRESFAVQSLPDDIKKLEIQGFGEDLISALKKYFKYYKIEVDAGAEIPEEFLNRPLSMRIFCESLNQRRQEVVHIDHFPSSMTHLFDAYIRNACIRIADMPNVLSSKQDLEDALYKLGIALWDSNGREVVDEDFIKDVHHVKPNWNQNIVNLLAQEGIVFRNSGATPASYVITPVYDALGGHIIATALLKKEGNDRGFKWLSTAISAGRFHGATSHPLSQDIFSALVSLIPSRMYGVQLWKVVPEEYKAAAVSGSIKLDAKYLDKETVEQIASLSKKNPQYQKELFSRLWRETKGATEHPLNADFLDKVLRELPMADRDLSWTEWLRKADDSYGNHLTEEVSQLQEKWQANEILRTTSDCLRAKALSWILTTTSHSLRDAATRALYWFGRGKPEVLFDLTIGALTINDPYVLERLLAASYGVSIALSKKESNGPLFSTGTLTTFAGDIFKNMFASEAKHKTTHQLSRDFASKIIELTQYHNPKFFSEEDIKKARPPFEMSNLPSWEEASLEENAESKSSPFRMDFENYTIGRLVKGRHGYDFQHIEYKKVKAQILWRVFKLGWSYDKFQSAERSIANGQSLHRRSGLEKLKVDRYGKKYSWIAYYEMMGFLRDKGLLDEEADWWRVCPENIDPSFMPKLENTSFIREDFLGDKEQSTQDWMKNSEAPDIDSYLRLKAGYEEDSDWVMLDGYVSQADEYQRSRDVFFFVRSFFVDRADVAKIVPLLENKHVRDEPPPEKPDLYNVYWAEVPWSDAFKDFSDCEWSFITGERTVLKNEKIPSIKIEAGGNTVFSESTEPMEYEIIEYENTTFKVTIPVCNIWSDVADGVSDIIVSLSKRLAIEMELCGQPQSTDLYLKNGKQGTRFISYRPDSDRNSHTAFYLREALLQKFLEKHNLSLVWLIWGERSYAFQDGRAYHNVVSEPRYAVFRNAKVYQ